MPERQVRCALAKVNGQLLFATDRAIGCRSHRRVGCGPVLRRSSFRSSTRASSLLDPPAKVIGERSQPCRSSRFRPADQQLGARLWELRTGPLFRSRSWQEPGGARILTCRSQDAIDSTNQNLPPRDDYHGGDRRVAPLLWPVVGDRLQANNCPAEQRHSPQQGGREQLRFFHTSNSIFTRFEDDVAAQQIRPQVYDDKAA